MSLKRLISLSIFMIVVFVFVVACSPSSPTGTTEIPDQIVTPSTPDSSDNVSQTLEAETPAMKADPSATPTTEPQPTSTPTPMPEPTATPTSEPTATPTPEPQPTDTATPEPTATDTSVPAEPVAILSGEFEGVGGDYTGSGSVTVYQQDGVGRTLEFNDFSVTSGPGLVVVLSSNPDVHLTRSIKEHVELGDLQSFTGDQAYQIPDDVDLAEYPVAVIYCKPFNAVFATATLQ